MVSNVVRMSPPSQPSQQGWMWNGSSWVWCFDPDDFPCPPSPCPPLLASPFPCPPPGFPTPCPPWFPPPAGQAPWYPGANGGVSFSATPPVNPIRGNFWWDGMVLHLFDGAVWVDIGPQVAGSGGIKGVTDGSVASPGNVGEIITQTSNGSINVNVPPGAAPTNFAALVVPAGDWNIQGTVSLTALTIGVYWDYIIFSLMNGSTTLISADIAGNFTGPNGFVGGTYSCAVLSISVAATTTVTCSLQVIAVNGGPNGTANYTFTTKGRRMR